MGHSHDFWEIQAALIQPSTPGFPALCRQVAGKVPLKA